MTDRIEDLIAIAREMFYRDPYVINISRIMRQTFPWEKALLNTQLFFLDQVRIYGLPVYNEFKPTTIEFYIGKKDEQDEPCT